MLPSHPTGPPGVSVVNPAFSCSSCGRHQGTADRQGLCPHVREKGSGKQNKVSAVGARAASHQLLSAPGSLAFQDVWELAFSVSYDHGRRRHTSTSLPRPNGRGEYLGRLSRWAGNRRAGRNGRPSWSWPPSPVPPVDRWAERPPGQSHGQRADTLDLEQLLTMETKLRLLELENVPIPETQPPPVPPPPPTSFCYDCSIAEP